MPQPDPHPTTPGPHRLHPTQRWLRGAAVLALVASAGACSLFGGQEGSDSDDSGGSPGSASPGTTHGSSGAACSAACGVDADCAGNAVCYRSKDGTRGCVPPECPACSDAGHTIRSGADLAPIVKSVFFAPGYADAHPADLAEVMAWVDGGARQTLAAEMDAMGTFPDLRPRLGELSMPIVARVGTADASSPVPWSEAIVKGAPNAKLELVDGVGHILLSEDRAATITAVAHALG